MHEVTIPQSKIARAAVRPFSLFWKPCGGPTPIMVDEGTSVTALVIDFLEAGLRQRGR